MGAAFPRPTAVGHCRWWTVLSICISDMRESDLDEVLAIEWSVFPEPWSRASFLHELREHGVAHLYVARSLAAGGGEAAGSASIVGYAGMWLVVDEAHITTLATHPKYRRCGVASRLLWHLFTVARQCHCERATLEVRPSNVAARRLYERFGFLAVGRRKRYYASSGEDALILSREGLRELDPQVAAGGSP